MSEELPEEPQAIVLPDVSTEPPPGLYDVEGFGRVLAHVGESYIVAMLDGRVCGFRAANGTPNEADAAAHIAAEMESPTLPPRSQAAIWAEKLAGRIADPETGIALAASIEVRNTLASTLVLYRELEEKGAITEATPQVLWDADNTAHALTMGEVRSILTRYGIAWQMMHADFAP